MFLFTPCLLLVLLPASSAFLAPFDEPYPQKQDTSYLLSNSSLPLENELRRRDDNCPINYQSCTTLAARYGGACCAPGYLCTTDAAHQIACCTEGAKCTGRLDSPRTTGIAGGMPPNSPAMTTTTDATAGPTPTGSVVVNAYFPFPYIPTTYPDSTACLSAYSACQTNYAACAANLQGTSYGVTIIAPAGGITISPTVQNLGVTSATNICHSLSSQACYGIQKSDCSQYGNVFVNPSRTNAVARPTMGAFATAGIVAGMGWGIAGQMA